jgi:hypothetical protein
MEKSPESTLTAVDIGSTKISAAFSIVQGDGTELVRHFLRFRGGGDSGWKGSDELPAIAARSRDGWEFGDAARTTVGRGGGVIFTDLPTSSSASVRGSIQP